MSVYVCECFSHSSLLLLPNYFLQDHGGFGCTFVCVWMVVCTSVAVCVWVAVYTSVAVCVSVHVCQYRWIRTINQCSHSSILQPEWYDNLRCQPTWNKNNGKLPLFFFFVMSFFLFYFFDKFFFRQFFKNFFFYKWIFQLFIIWVLNFYERDSAGRPLKVLCVVCHKSTLCSGCGWLCEEC